MVSSPSPNPFNTTARFFIEVPRAGLLTARFYDISGRMVHQETSGVRAGFYALDFVGDDLPSGVYFYTVSMGDRDFKGKMTIMK